MKTPELEINNILGYRTVLLEELFSLDQKIENCIDNQDFDSLLKELDFRSGLLEKVLKLDKKLKSNSKKKVDVDESYLKKHTDLTEKIKLAESKILTKLYLKKDEIFSDYQNLVRGLDTLKGYRNSLYKGRDTIDIL